MSGLKLDWQKQLFVVDHWSAIDVCPSSKVSFASPVLRRGQMVSLIEPRFQFIGSTFLTTTCADEHADDPSHHIQDVLGKGARVRRHSWSHHSYRHRMMMDFGLDCTGDDWARRLAVCIKDRKRLRIQASSNKDLARQAEGCVKSFGTCMRPPIADKQANVPMKTDKLAIEKLRSKVRASHALQLVAQFMEEDTREGIAAKDVELQNLWSMISTPELPEPVPQIIFFQDSEEQDIPDRSFH